MQIKFQILNKKATLPSCASIGSAGFDLHACIEDPEKIAMGEWKLINTGIAIELPRGHFGMVCSRSGLAKKFGLTVLNAPGIIDCDYRGEIGVILKNSGAAPVEIESGQRIAQLLIVPYEQPKWVQVDALSETDRGTGGFGSTGV